MATIELRDSDTDRMKALNAKNGYGLDIAQMNRLINEYQKGDTYKRTLIEYRLTDINFHREVAMLKDGKYEELKAQVAKW